MYSSQNVCGILEHSVTPFVKVIIHAFTQHNRHLEFDTDRIYLSRGERKGSVRCNLVGRETHLDYESLVHAVLVPVYRAKHDDARSLIPVSYTHLTLPTIYSV